VHAADGTGAAVIRAGFLSPETVLYDPDQDVYFVSNINGNSAAEDGNGYISRISAGDHNVVTRWIDGMAPDVTLNAPKGMTISGEDLWVADINIVRAFDRKTGKEKSAIAVPDSIYLNDIATGPNEFLYVSDSGMPGNTEGPNSKGMDAVYQISPNRGVERIAASQMLNRPDGLFFLNGALWIAAFGSNELYQLINGNKASVQHLPKGALDGLFILDGGTFLVSSWDANGVYSGSIGGPFELIVSGIQAPADFAVDSKRNLIVVPHLMENAVSFHPLSRAIGRPARKE